MSKRKSTPSTAANDNAKRVTEVSLEMRIRDRWDRTTVVAATTIPAEHCLRIASDFASIARKNVQVCLTASERTGRPGRLDYTYETEHYFWYGETSGKRTDVCAALWDEGRDKE